MLLARLRSWKHPAPLIRCFLLSVHHLHLFAASFLHDLIRTLAAALTRAPNLPLHVERRYPRHQRQPCSSLSSVSTAAAPYYPEPPSPIHTQVYPSNAV